MAARGRIAPLPLNWSNEAQECTSCADGRPSSTPSRRSRSVAGTGIPAAEVQAVPASYDRPQPAETHERSHPARLTLAGHAVSGLISVEVASDAPSRPSFLPVGTKFRYLDARVASRIDLQPLARLFRLPEPDLLGIAIYVAGIVDSHVPAEDICGVTGVYQCGNLVRQRTLAWRSTSSLSALSIETVTSVVCYSDLRVLAFECLGLTWARFFTIIKLVTAETAATWVPSTAPRISVASQLAERFQLGYGFRAAFPRWDDGVDIQIPPQGASRERASGVVLGDEGPQPEDGGKCAEVGACPAVRGYQLCDIFTNTCKEEEVSSPRCAMAALAPTDTVFARAISEGTAHVLRDQILLRSNRGRRYIALYYLLTRHGAMGAGAVRAYAKALPSVLPAVRALCGGDDDDVVIDDQVLRALRLVAGAQTGCGVWWTQQIAYALADAEHLQGRTRAEVLTFLYEG